MIKTTHIGVARVDGPVIVVEKTRNVAYGEVVKVKDGSGNIKYGQVIEVSTDLALVQVFGSTTGIAKSNTEITFLGKTLQIPVSKDMLGRVYNGLGQPADGAPQIFSKNYRDVNGAPINPYSRAYPRDFIQTGISVIDGLTTLVRGQKLPIFSGNGMPHNRLAAQIVRQAKLITSDEEFVIVFAAMGVKKDVASFFIKTFEQSGALQRVAMFLSLADSPSMERLITPRCALTLAEHLAFDENMHVLVIMTDMTNYAESLREIATIKGEIPSRKGYPGYLYSDFASLYERAGRINTSSGSITQIPILTMPSDDISHPVPDLTGYITEGQIVFERDMFAHGIYPPIAGLPSLSRLMKDGIGEGRTRADHPHIASQLFASYARVKDVRALASVIGEEELSDIDKIYMDFGREFESRFVSQGEYEDRSIEQTLDLAWDIISILPKSELYRVTEEEIKKYYKAR